MRLLFIVAALGLLGACRPPEGGAVNSSGVTSSDGIRVILELEGEPTVGLVPVRVSIDESGAGVRGASVEVIGEMTHAGMVPVVARARQVGPGEYLADEFEFTMAGDWILSAEVSLEKGQQLTAVRALTVEQR